MSGIRFEKISNAQEVLRVGDRVRSNSMGSTEGEAVYTGKVTFIDVREGGFTISREDGKTGNGYQNGWIVYWDSYGFIEIIKSSSQSAPSSMARNIIDFFQNLTASAEEKLLKKHGVEDPIGTPTETGLKLSAQIQYMANRAKVIEIVKELEAEEEKDKKKKGE